MKKVYLHGELGETFGKVWDLSVQTPREAVLALFANNPEIEKYIRQKESERIYYSAQYANGERLLSDTEYDLKTPKDLHVVPVPGGGAFVGSLLMMAATTFVSMWIQKKLSETFDRKSETLVSQSKSFLFDGGQNRYQQGSTVPLGYGTMKLGSNVISSCVLNYEYDSDSGKIVEFDQGLLFSLVPSYSPDYDESLGPVLSTLQFDGNQEFRATDPSYARIKGRIPGLVFGPPDTLYGGFVPQEQQLESTGNGWGGYLHYKFKMAEGLKLDQWGGSIGGRGNFVPATQLSQDANGFPVVKGGVSWKSSVVLMQSVPLLESDENSYQDANKEYYPILWAEGASNAQKTPKLVGQRWVGGNKTNGVGWHKMESTSIYKAVDLVCEGPVGGFADKNGNVLSYSETYTNEGDSSLRNRNDDYLQGIFLDEIPVKEVNDQDDLDSYNINEFDVDVGIDSNGLIGGDDQKLLKDEYLFTAHSTEINQPLYGPRLLNSSVVTEQGGASVEDFLATKAYQYGDVVKASINGEENLFKNILDMNLPYTNTVCYLDEETAKIAHHEEGFYTPDHSNSDGADISWDDYPYFYAEHGPYSPGDKVSLHNAVDGCEYYELGPHADKLIGLYDKTKREEYVQNRWNLIILGTPDEVLFDGERVTTYGSWYVVTGDSTTLGNLPSSTRPSINDIAFPLNWAGDGDSLFSDPAEMCRRIDENPGIQDFVGTDLEINTEYIKGFFNDAPDDLSPSAQPSLWSQLTVTSPTDIIRDGGENGSENIASRVWQPIGSNDAQRVMSDQEEFYVSHRVINPLVEQIYVGLQIDELNFIYPGDKIEVTYEIGEYTTALLAIVTALGIAGTLQGFDVPSSVSFGAALAGGIATFFVIDDMRIKMGTKVENSGELWPNRAWFRIKYGNEGETLYSTDLKFYGIVTAGYRKDVKIYFPPNPDNKDRILKVYKLNRERNPAREGELAARYKEKCSLNAVTEIVPTKLNYPNSMVVGSRVNARDVGRIPTRSYSLKLKKVAIPSNYDPTTRKYDGNWNGLFKGQLNLGDQVADQDKEWTDNPAWCMYDLISNKSYGVGKFGIKYENIDRWTLYKMAKYCDELVPTGYSSKYKKRKFVLDQGGTYIDIQEDSYTGSNALNFGNEFAKVGKNIALFYEDGTYGVARISAVNVENKRLILAAPIERGFDESMTGEVATEIDYPLLEPRYTLNAVLKEEQNAFKLINEFASVFRSYAYWAGGAINFFQDEKRESVMFFNNGNVANEGFAYSSTPKTSRINNCKVRFYDKHNKYRPKMEFSEDKDAVIQNNIIEQTLEGFGITSKSQAKRAADFMVKSANLETEIISFKTNIIGSYLRPGDVIEVLDNKRTIGRFAGKINNVKIDPEGKFMDIYLDYPINSVIDPWNRDTWKDIKIYDMTEFETIQSLDNDAPRPIKDERIDNMRASQIGNVTAVELSENKERLRVIENKYEYIEGEYTFRQAFSDAGRRSGQLASIGSSADQYLVSLALPKEEGLTAWIGGYLREIPPPERLEWLYPKGCDNAGIGYSNWADGFPIIGDIITRDNEDFTITDAPAFKEMNVNEELFIITDPITDLPDHSNFFAVSGSENQDFHSKWIMMQDKPQGYILERKIQDEGIYKYKGIKNKSFVIEDGVNFAKPKTYKVITIKEESNGVFEIQGMEYNDDKFDNIEKDLSLSNPNSPIIFTEQALEYTVNSNVTILEETIEDPVTFEETTNYKLQASWSTDQRPSAFRIQYFNQKDLIATFELPRTLETEYSHTIDGDFDPNGNYYVRVYLVY